MDCRDGSQGMWAGVRTRSGAERQLTVAGAAQALRPERVRAPVSRDSRLSRSYPQIGLSSKVECKYLSKALYANLTCPYPVN